MKTVTNDAIALCMVPCQIPFLHFITQPKVTFQACSLFVCCFSLASSSGHFPDCLKVKLFSFWCCRSFAGTQRVRPHSGTMAHKYNFLPHPQHSHTSPSPPRKKYRDNFLFLPDIYMLYTNLITLEEYNFTFQIWKRMLFDCLCTFNDSHDTIKLNWWFFDLKQHCCFFVNSFFVSLN